MNQHHELTTDACLLIFDPHQDKEWIQRVLGKEREKVSHLLLGGDYFDCFESQRHVGVGEMAEYLLELAEEWGQRLTVLLGNHDVPYAEAQVWSQQGLTPPRLIHECPGWTSEKSIEVAEVLDWSFWESCRLFTLVNGCLISHAGLAKFYWAYPYLSDSESLHCIEEYAYIIKRAKYAQPFGLLCVGEGRGGRHETGGLTWLDCGILSLKTSCHILKLWGTHRLHKAPDRMAARGAWMAGRPATAFYTAMAAWKSNNSKGLSSDML